VGASSPAVEKTATETSEARLRKTLQPAEASRTDRESDDLLDVAPAKAGDAIENQRGTGARIVRE
jgi:hypothetical protein